MKPLHKSGRKAFKKRMRKRIEQADIVRVVNEPRLVRTTSTQNLYLNVLENIRIVCEAGK